ncbi:hypothetical protein [Wolbachia endosymbiont of Tettigetta isshikii]|uniref:hypothetical protein n=1 Tax=Wolbachia endosymbiont of Tettigetta isshikii TaxID=3239093 RepID=UPI00398079F4
MLQCFSRSFNGYHVGRIAVSTLVAGIVVGLAIYFLSQDREQAKAIEKAINSKPPSVNNVVSVTADGKEQLQSSK